MKRTIHILAIICFASIGPFATANDGETDWADILFPTYRFGYPLGVSFELSPFPSSVVSSCVELGALGAKASLGLREGSGQYWAATSIRASIIHMWSDLTWGDVGTYHGVELAWDSLICFSAGYYRSPESKKEKWYFSLGIPIIWF